MKMKLIQDCACTKGPRAHIDRFKKMWAYLPCLNNSVTRATQILQNVTLLIKNDYFEHQTWGSSRACVQAGPALLHVININTPT